MLKVSFANQTDFTVDEPRYKRLIEQTLRHEKQSVENVTISFVGTKTIASLNAQYRELDKPTDVLSFPFDSEFPHGNGGEVVIAPAIALANRGADRLTAELDLLLVHGLLHLLGHEDATESGQQLMEQQAMAILRAPTRG